MDFFEAQEQARRRSFLLVALFACAVVGIIAAVYVAAHLALGPGGVGIDIVLLGQVALGVGLVVGFGSIYRTASLRAGGPAVADLMGARRLAPDTTDPDERRFLNVVEEMAIASGTPVPAVYVMDAEDGINAFAAGYSPHDAAVAVTRGALRQLSRDELQGVIAHEFSHILNGDMRLNVRLIGLIYGILLLAVVGRAVMYTGPRGRRGGRDGGGGIIILGLALLLVGYIGMFFGKLIKAAVSRQREYLADSAAVEFTRNPLGLAGALKKIGATSAGSRFTNPRAEELSHLFFANGVGRSVSLALSTHPPLDDRIRRLDPSWTGRFDAVDRGTEGALPDMVSRAAPAPEAVAGFAGRGAEAHPSAETAVASVGAPQPEHLALARSFIENLQRPLQDAVHTTPGAQALVLALAMADSAGEDLDAEWNVVRRYGDPAITERVAELLPLIRSRGQEHRLPLLDLALPSLLRLGPDEAERFLATVHATVTADARVRLFEYTMLRTLSRRLHGGTPAGEARHRTHSFAPLAEPTAALLSALAWTGSGWDEATARKAFAAGVARLPSDVGRIEFLPLDQISIEGIDRALSSFDGASPAVRKRLLEVCSDVALYDRTVTPSEMEMVRAVAEALDCPMPPLVRLSNPPERSASITGEPHGTG